MSRGRVAWLCILESQRSLKARSLLRGRLPESDRFLIDASAPTASAPSVALIASFPRVAALTDDLTRVTAAMAAIGLAVYPSVDGSPWVHRLRPSSGAAGDAEDP